MKPGYRIFCYVVATCFLMAVFSLYLRPDFLVIIANQFWSCF